MRESPTFAVDQLTAAHDALDTLEIQRSLEAAVFETVDVGMVLLDQDGQYLMMNRRHEDFVRMAFPTGHSGRAGQVGEVFALDGVTRLTAEEMPTVRAARGEEFDDITCWVGADPQTRRAVSVSARSVWGTDGSRRGSALTFKDVTDFMLTMKAKDDFIASISHEFRTPLTSIIGYVSMLMEDDELMRPSQSQHLKVVVRNADRLHRLVSDLLLTLEPEDVRLAISPSTTDASEVVRASVEAAQPAAWARGVELSFRNPGQLSLTVDRQRFAQVVDNLISNAIKFSPQGGPVDVELARDGDVLVLTVRDRGIGMSGKDMDRLFSRFFRAREVEDRSIQGVGLGLSIVKRIVDSHDGQISVESALGEGSTFRVELPAPAVVDEPPAPAEEAEPEPEPDPEPGPEPELVPEPESEVRSEPVHEVPVHPWIAEQLGQVPKISSA